MPLKKYFYVLRPLLACRWITQTPPPMLFPELMEAGLGPALSPLVAALMEWLTAYVQELPNTSSRSWAALDRYFLSVLDALI